MAITQPNSDITIIVIAYNRVESLKRILHSLQKARYDDAPVRLLISIDKSDNDEISRIAQDFLWEHGEKIVEIHAEHLGLHKHVIQCGNFTERFGNIIMLEDDLYVSPNFYWYTKNALSFYQSDKRIAGISLYSMRVNETARRPFEPLKSNGDTFFMQLASSWGQAWNFVQWQDFKKWYIQNASTNINENSNLPSNIISWPESSWKKYFMKYLVEKNKYIVYPYLSYTTNFGDKGTHFTENTDIFQVPLDMSDAPIFQFCRLEESNSVYDIFYENINLYKALKKLPEQLTIDLFGTKKTNAFKRYVLTSQFLNYKLIQSFNSALRPHELNIMENLHGTKLFLYDTRTEEEDQKTSGNV